MTEWSSCVNTFSDIAKSQPQAAFSALTHGLLSKWTYLCRVLPNISQETIFLPKTMSTVTASSTTKCRRNPTSDRKTRREIKMKHSESTHNYQTGFRKLTQSRKKGASTWLTALPLTEDGFTLHKSGFHDALALRYGWVPAHLLRKCACGNNFSVEHSLSCAKRDFLPSDITKYGSLH